MNERLEQIVWSNLDFMAKVYATNFCKLQLMQHTSVTDE